jgi:hypothetical protein
MAIITNTYQSTAAIGNREEISDVVDRITPEDTPMYSAMGKGKASSTNPKWEIDTIRAPAANAQLEGDVYSFNGITPPEKVGNHTQIFRDSWIISKTQEAVDNVGKVEKQAEAKIKTGIALRKDVELSILSNSASVAGSTRVSGGLPSWLETNVSRGATGANGGYSTATGLTVAETTGTQRAMTKAQFDSVMSQVYTSGGTVRDVQLSPYNKSVFVTFMSDANVAEMRSSADGSGKKTLHATADIYEGPYGKVTVTPNRVMATSAAVARRAFFNDYDKLEWLWLRPLQEDPDVHVNADAEAGVIIGEGTLKVKNEAGLGVIADLFGLTSAS